MLRFPRLGSHWARSLNTRRFLRVSASLQAPTTKPAKPVPDLITVNIDGVDVSVDKDLTVLQACEENGVHIPRFCYHDRLSIAGNCRMCLVEVIKSPKPVASCAMPLMPGMQIKTNTPLVKKAREGVMEFLLSNHPLDCPICDQGGECDLQDLSMAYGSDRGRYNEFKRTVEDKNLGPFIKTIMTRCIHCTRCVRFAEEVAGVPDLGVTGRGNSMEIGTYIDKYFDSELSGNVVDLCPVGALTSKPFAFTARPWELIKTESIDVHDALGSNIRIDVRGQKVMRIQPRVNEAINEEWLSDRSRYSYDGLYRQRLDTPLLRKGSNQALEEVTWPEALDYIADRMKRLKPNQIRALTGDLVDAEAMMVLKDFFNRLGSTNIDCRQDRAQHCADHRANYLFNTTMLGIEEADVCMLVGTNPRMEAALLNTRLRKAIEFNCLVVGSIGPAADLTYSHVHIGTEPSVLNELVEGRHDFSRLLFEARKPMFIFGQSALCHSDADAFKSIVSRLAEKVQLFKDDWNGLNVLQTAASRGAGLDLGLVPGPGKDYSDIKLVYLLGADEFADDEIPKDAFVVYQGHHGDKGATRADVILPGTAYTEKSGTYVNTEGRVQRTTIATTPIGQARQDWQIVRALAELCGIDLSYSSLEAVRERMYEVAPHLREENSIMPSLSSEWREGPAKPKAAFIKDRPLVPSVDDFFRTNAICRASSNMAKGSVELPNSANSYV